MNKKLPKWLTSARYSLSSPPYLKVDQLIDQGVTDLDVRDIVKRRPSQKFKAVKKATKQLAVMEEWVEYMQGKKGISKE